MQTVPYQRPTRRKRRTRAFSLVEILIVIALIAILATVAIGNLGGIFGGQQEKIAQQVVNQGMKLGLTAYKLDIGNYPSTEEGLSTGAHQRQESRWKGPSRRLRGHTDPWGNPYQYRFLAQKCHGSRAMMSGHSARTAQAPMTSATGNKPTTPQRRHGFSLIEIVLVVGLIAAVAGLMIANIGVIADRSSEPNTEELVKAAIRSARFEAARSRSMAYLSYDEDGGRLEVSTEAGGSSQFALGEVVEAAAQCVYRSLQPGLEHLPTRHAHEWKPAKSPLLRIEVPAFVLEIDYGVSLPNATSSILSPTRRLTLKMPPQPSRGFTQSKSALAIFGGAAAALR